MRMIKDLATSKTRGMKTVRLLLLLAVFVGVTVSLFPFLTAAAQTKYIIRDGDSVIVCMSNSTDPEEVIRQAGLSVTDADRISTDLQEEGEVNIHIDRVQMVSVRDGGQVYVYGGYGGTVSDVLESLGITLSQSDTLSCTLDTEIYDGMVVEITRIVLETVEYEEAIPFETKVYEDDSLAPGTEQVLVEGVEGKTHYTAQITFKNGAEADRTILSQHQVAAPQDAIVLRGVDRSVMEQTYRNTDDYIVSTYYYSYTPPTEEERAEAGTKLVPGTTLPYNTAVLFDATAYTCNSPNYLGNGRTFTGTQARVGAIAVDPRVIPLGTRMYITSADGEYVYGYCVAEDTGSVIKGNLVDLYFDTHDECVRFGRRDIIIYFLD